MYVNAEKQNYKLLWCNKIKASGKDPKFWFTIRSLGTKYELIRQRKARGLRSLAELEEWTNNNERNSKRRPKPVGFVIYSLYENTIWKLPILHAFILTIYQLLNKLKIYQPIATPVPENGSKLPLLLTPLVFLPTWLMSVLNMSKWGCAFSSVLDSFFGCHWGCSICYWLL